MRAMAGSVRVGRRDVLRNAILIGIKIWNVYGVEFGHLV